MCTGCWYHTDFLFIIYSVTHCTRERRLRLLFYYCTTATVARPSFFLFFFFYVPRIVSCWVFSYVAGFRATSADRSLSSAVNRRHRTARAAYRHSPCSASMGSRDRALLSNELGARRLPRREKGRLRDADAGAGAGAGTSGGRRTIEASPRAGGRSMLPGEAAAVRAGAAISRGRGVGQAGGRLSRQERCLRLHALDGVDVLPLVEATVGVDGGSVGGIETAAGRKVVSADDIESIGDGRRPPDGLPRRPSLAVVVERGAGADDDAPVGAEKAFFSREREPSRRSRGGEWEERERGDVEDDRFMRMALRLAERARLAGEVPVRENSGR